MKVSRKNLIAAILLPLFWLVGCAQQATFQTGPDAEITHDGLTRVDNARFDAVWARTDIDLSGYNKIMLQGAEIQYRPVEMPRGTRLARSNSNQSEFPLTDKQKQRLADTITNAFRREIENSKQFTLVNEPGPGVLLVRGTLIDVVSNVPPPSVGRVDVYLHYVGEATLVLELFDLESGAILARGVDRRAAGDSTRFLKADSVTSWSEVNRLASTWAGILGRGLESLTGPTPE